MKLGALQRMLQQAVLGNPEPLLTSIHPAGAKASERIAIYRHQLLDSLTAALAEVYPVTRQLVGGDYFDQLARMHIDTRPPRTPLLAMYGGDFAATIDGSEGCARLPYLADVARLEWLLHEADRSAGDAPLDMKRAAEALKAGDDQRLELIASFGLLRSQWPIDAIWRAHQRDELAERLELENRLAFIEVASDEHGTYVRSLSTGEHALREKLAAGATIAEAASAAAAAEPTLDLVPALSAIFASGLVASVRASA